MAEPNENVGSSEDVAELEGEPIIAGYSNINEYSQQALRSVLQATRASNELPTGDDYEFYSTYDSVRDVLHIEGRRILQLIQGILRQQNVKAKFSSSNDSVDLEDKFDTLMDTNDQILERVGSSLDEAAGIRKPDATLIVATATTRTATAASWNKQKSSPKTSTFRLLAARNIQRPQLKFKDKIDNGNRPFIPGIKSKPNSQQSLEDSLKLPENITVEDMENPGFIYPHPYHYELDHIQYDPAQLTEVKPQDPLALDKTSLDMVDGLPQLQDLCDHLTTVQEFAVDLEAHSYRTFQGFTCLMQISTRQRDFIIDTLAVREHMHLLNHVFTDPRIVKVLHGSDSDIQWLQRDFNIYVVNMFDTGQAARVLQHSRFSLAHLLKIYCQVDADKQYQLADWRMRPLPEELLKYAREDTHYLLYIYDKMRNELIQQGNTQNNLTLSVLRRSTQICAQVYKKQVFSESQYLELYRKNKKLFNSQQLYALAEIFAWRNKVARLEDESNGYVLPNHMLLQISEILPREKQGILACCNPIPPLVRQNLSEIHTIIMQAREKPLVKAEAPKPVYPSTSHHSKYDSNSLLNCPHDLSHPDTTVPQDRPQPDASKIINPSLLQVFGSIKLCDQPKVVAFAWPSKVSEQWREKVQRSLAQEKAEEIRKSFISPFQMYMPREKKKAQVHVATDNKNSSPWRLKANTKVEEETESQTTSESETDPVTGQPVHVYEPPIKKMKVDTVTNPTISQEEMDTEILLRQDMPKKKKKKKKKSEVVYEADVPPSMQTKGPVKGKFLGAEVEEEEITPASQEEEAPVAASQHMKKKKKKKKKRNIDDVEEGFQPYDYSAVDKKLFQGSTSGDSYNPGKFRKGRKDKKFKHNSSRGNRSVTFKK